MLLYFFGSDQATFGWFFASRLEQLIPYLELQLQGDSPVHSITNGRNDKDIGADDVAFPGERWKGSWEPAAIVGCRVATKAANDGA